MISKKVVFGAFFMLLVAAMVMCFSPPVNAAEKNSVRQSLMNDGTAALGISAQGLSISAKLFSNTDLSVTQRVFSSMVNSNWTKDVAFTGGQLVNNSWNMSKDVTNSFTTWTAQFQLLNGNNGTVGNSAYVMAWTTSNSLMFNMADYDNAVTNSWNNNISAFNNSNNFYNFDANYKTKSTMNYQS